MPFRTISVCLLSLLLTANVLAQSAVTNAPASEQVNAQISALCTVEKDIRYVPNGEPAQALDVYLPRQTSDKPFPLIIWIHGGGWSGGSKNQVPMLWLLRSGYALASVEYRFTNRAKFPAQIQDCQAAIRFLRANAKKYNIDPDHIGVWGQSAGGHLVALLATAGGKNAFPPIGGNENQSDRVQAVCDYFGPTDFTTALQHAREDKSFKNADESNAPNNPAVMLLGVKLGEDETKSAAASPVHYVSKDNPPFLILHGMLDPTVPFAQSAELHEKLLKAGVDSTFQKFPNSAHGGGAIGRSNVNDLVKKFFDKHLKGIDAKIEALPMSEVTVVNAK